MKSLNIYPKQKPHKIKRPDKEMVDQETVSECPIQEAIKENSQRKREKLH